MVFELNIINFTAAAQARINQEIVSNRVVIEGYSFLDFPK
jgi:hypothetical protein